VSEELADNVRKLRRRAGLSQEELAHASGFSVGTIRKIEQGGSVRIETLHGIARALGVRTSDLLASGAPQPVSHDETETLNLRDLRIALTPRIRLSGIPEMVFDEPDIGLLRQVTYDTAILYRAGRYGRLAATLPTLIRDANSAVTYYEGSETEHRQALLARAAVLGLAGNYLAQIRQYDMAHTAVRACVGDAQAAGSDQATAAYARTLCFTLLRTGRFDEAEEVAVEAMDLVEPKISGASADGAASRWRRLPPQSGTTAHGKPPNTAGLPRSPLRPSGTRTLTERAPSRFSDRSSRRSSRWKTR
jgi:transcriptional regulator with XRE-family HTH domain